MGQYSILLNNQNKQLIATNKINLRQHESLMDKLCFVVEYQYTEEIDLRDFSVVLYWLDPTNVVHTDILVKEEDVYKENYQRYFLPVECPLSRYAGDIDMKLVFTKTDYETACRYKLETESILVPITTIKDYFSVIPNESFDAFNDAIDEIKAQTDALIAAAEVYEKTKADNININPDGEVQLQSNGNFIGNSLNLAIVKNSDTTDENEDGVLDITGKYSEIIL